MPHDPDDLEAIDFVNQLERNRYQHDVPFEELANRVQRECFRRKYFPKRGEPTPTKQLPGTEAKIADLANRWERRQEMHHPLDSFQEANGTIVLRYERSANGKDLVVGFGLADEKEAG